MRQRKHMHFADSSVLQQRISCSTEQQCHKKRELVSFLWYLHIYNPTRRRPTILLPTTILYDRRRLHRYHVVTRSPPETMALALEQFRIDVEQSAIWYNATTRDENTLDRETVNDLDKMQTLVGGFIEMTTFGEYYIIFNEEGRLTPLPLNQTMGRLGLEIFGNVIVAHKSLVDC